MQQIGNNQLELDVIVVHRNTANVRTPDPKKFIVEKRLLHR